MKKAIPLSVKKRNVTENVKTMRTSGNVPGIVYGNVQEGFLVTCNAKALQSVHREAGENTLIDMEIDGKKVPCLIHSVTFHPVSGNYEHIDFYAVDMTKKVTTHVPVVLQGECPAVKNFGGVLLTVHSQLEVSCLPTDIPASFVVDLSKLENLRDSVTVGMLNAPKEVTIHSTPETTIVIVQEPRKEEVIEPVPGTEGAVPAEGETPAEGTAAAAPGAPAAGKTEAKASAAPAKK